MSDCKNKLPKRGKYESVHSHIDTLERFERACVTMGNYEMAYKAKAKIAKLVSN